MTLTQDAAMMELCESPSQPLGVAPPVDRGHHDTCASPTTPSLSFDDTQAAPPSSDDGTVGGGMQDFDLAPQLGTPLVEERLLPLDQSSSDNTTDVQLAEPSQVVPRRKLPQPPQSLDAASTSLSLSPTDTNAAESSHLQSFNAIQNIFFNADEVRTQLSSCAIVSLLHVIVNACLLFKA